MRFHEMTAPEIRDIDRQATVVVAPIAACEQHSHHLPTFTDTLLVTAVAESAEQLRPTQIVLLPTLWFGASHHHLPFGGTLSAPADTHATMLCELLTPLLDDEFQRILILNGHGGNIDTMKLALRTLQPQYPARILTAAAYWDLAEAELAAIAEGPRKVMGHACEFETSMVMAVRPDLVREKLRKDDPPRESPALRGLYICEDMAQSTTAGTIGYPQLATADKGRRMIAAAAGRVAEVVDNLLARPLPV